MSFRSSPRTTGWTASGTSGETKDLGAVDAGLDLLDRTVALDTAREEVERAPCGVLVDLHGRGPDPSIEAPSPSGSPAVSASLSESTSRGSNGLEAAGLDPGHVAEVRSRSSASWSVAAPIIST